MLEIVPRFHPLESAIPFTHSPDSRTLSPIPIPAILATLSASLNATPIPAIVDAITLSELIILTITPPIHGESLPAFNHHLASHCRRSDPKPGHYIQRHTLAGGATLYIPAHRIGTKESLCWQEGDGGGTLPHTAEIAGQNHKRSTPNSDTNSFSPVSSTAPLRPSVATATCAVSLYSYWTSSMPSFFAVSREEVS